MQTVVAANAKPNTASVSSQIAPSMQSKQNAFIVGYTHALQIRLGSSNNFLTASKVSPYIMPVYGPSWFH